MIYLEFRSRSSAQVPVPITEVDVGVERGDKAEFLSDESLRGHQNFGVHQYNCLSGIGCGCFYMFLVPLKFRFYFIFSLVSVVSRGGLFMAKMILAV